MTENNQENQISLFDLGLCCGRMSSEPSAQTTARTFAPSLKKPQESPIPTPQFLDCRPGSHGLTAEPLWDLTGLSLGAYTMRSFGESPNDAVESRLSLILEDNPPPRYYLSARACQGILNRAGKRGKELPPILRDALMQQVSRSKSGGGSETDRNGKRAGKGALIQTELSATLGVSQDQTLIQPKAFGIGSFDSEGMKSSNPNVGIYEAETARTLDLNGGNPACNQGGIAIVEPQGVDVYNFAVTGDVNCTLKNRDYKEPPLVLEQPPTYCIDQGGGKKDAAVSVDKAPTLATTHDGAPVVCIEGNGSRESHQGDGYKQSETMYTLNTVETHAVCYSQDAYDEYNETESAASIKASGANYGGVPRC